MFSLFETQSLAGLPLPYIMMQSFSPILVVFYWGLPNCKDRSKLLKRRIPADLLQDPRWWRDLLPVWNVYMFFFTLQVATPWACIPMHTSGLAWAVIICLAGISPFAVLLPRQPLATSFDINLLEMEAINFTLQGPIWASWCWQITRLQSWDC